MLGDVLIAVLGDVLIASVGDVLSACLSDVDFVKKVRTQMPLMKQRRRDIYRVTDLSN